MARGAVRRTVTGMTTSPAVRDAGPFRFVKTDHFYVGSTRVNAGALVIWRELPHRVVAHVENLDTGASWVDLINPANHRYGAAWIKDLLITA